MDFTLVTPRLGVGVPVTSEDDAAALVAVGFTTVVNLTVECLDAVLIGHPRLSVFWNGTANDDSEKSIAWFSKTLNYVLPVFARPNSKVYLHCALGQNRSPISALAVMLALGWDASTAESIIRAKRPEVTLVNRDDAIRAASVLGFT